MRWHNLKTFDWSLYIIPILLITIGIATIYTITYASEGNSLAISQGIFAAIGLVLMFGLTFVDYRLFKGLSLPIYIIGLLFLLILVVKPFSTLPFVVESFGATRWIYFGFFQFQPSEFFKFVLIITLASYLSTHKNNMRWWHIVGVIGMTAVPVLMTLKQPDLGTASVLVVIMVAMLMAAKLSKIYYAVLGGMAAVMTPISWFFLKDYQRERLATFLNPGSDPLGTGYNVTQSMIAVGSGGVYGRGLGQGSQSQLNFLPVAHTDFIFAGFAEASGFIGAFVLIVLFMILFMRILGVARTAKDDFGMFLAVGVAAMILFQVFVNIGMNVAIMPVTGIPLPFVSSGGTALFVTMMAVGILQSVYLRHKKITF